MAVGLNIGGSDWLGLGKALEGRAETRSVDGCGRRPLIGGDGKDAFDECVESKNDLAELSLKGRQKLSAMSIFNRSNRSKGGLTLGKNNKFLIIAVAVIAVVVLIVIFKKK